jgi:hypothetical protein
MEGDMSEEVECPECYGTQIEHAMQPVRFGEKIATPKPCSRCGGTGLIKVEHDPRPLADPAVAARKLLELANAVEPVQDARIHIEKINGLFLFKEGGTGAVHCGARSRHRQGLALEA